VEPLQYEPPTPPQRWRLGFGVASIALAVIGAAILIGTIAQYGLGHHGGEVGFSVAAGGAATVVVSMLAAGAGLFGMVRSDRPTKQVSLLGLGLSIAAVIGVFASGLCGR